MVKSKKCDMGNKFAIHVLSMKVWAIIFSIPIFITITLVLLQYRPKMKERKPNILFILADNMGWNDVGMYNNVF